MSDQSTSRGNSQNGELLVEVRRIADGQAEIKELLRQLLASQKAPQPEFTPIQADRISQAIALVNDPRVGPNITRIAKIVQCSRTTLHSNRTFMNAIEGAKLQKDFRRGSRSESRRGFYKEGGEVEAIDKSL